MADLKKVGGYTISEEYNEGHNVLTLKSDDRRAIATVDAKTGEFTLGYRLYSEEDDKFHKYNGSKQPFEFLTAVGFDASATHEFLNLISIRSNAMRTEHQLRSIQPRQ